VTEPERTSLIALLTRARTVAAFYAAARNAGSSTAPEHYRALRRLLADAVALAEANRPTNPGRDDR
jgi:hypothetical protein